MTRGEDLPGVDVERFLEIPDNRAHERHVIYVFGARGYAASRTFMSTVRPSAVNAASSCSSLDR
jgi:hypothetical protein